MLQGAVFTASTKYKILTAESSKKISLPMPTTAFTFSPKAKNRDKQKVVRQTEEKFTPVTYSLQERKSIRKAHFLF
jgi:hypothetical protein